MKTRGIIILFIFALLAISGYTIAQASCQNVLTAEMIDQDNGYVTPASALNHETNCITITGFPEDAEALELAAWVTNTQDLFDVYIYPGNTSTFTTDYSLTQQSAVSEDNNLSMTMDSFFSSSYTIGIIGRQGSDFEGKVSIRPIHDLPDAVPSICGADRSQCEFSFIAEEFQLVRTLIIHCMGEIQANVAGNFHFSSESLQIFVPRGTNPVAQENGRSINFSVNEGDILREGFWKVVYTVRGLESLANPRLFVTAPRGDCRPSGSTAGGSGYEGQASDSNSRQGIAGARITFVSEDGSFSTEVVSNPNGSYRIELPVGRYRVTATHPNFQTYSTGSGFFVVTGSGFQYGDIYMVQSTAGKGGSASCAGVEVAGSCWHFGADSASCDTVCSTHGGYDAATMSYAGSGGAMINCQGILAALSIPLDNFFETTQGGIGCFAIRNTSGNYSGYWDTQPTTASATSVTPGRRRVCACQQ